LKTQQTTISEVRLVYWTRIKASERLQVKCSKDAFDIFMENWDLDSIEHIEEFKLLLMNRSNSVLGIMPVSKGGLFKTVTDVRVILQYAIRVNASGIIICHNHPSGKVQPSESDIAITRKIKESGIVMDIQLLDHLIIVPESNCFSMGDEGIV
jgi:DNA repair protein RadC